MAFVLAVSGIDDAFYPAAWKVGTSLGLAPDHAGFAIAMLLFSESDITPSAINSLKCVGINQFCPGSLPSGITAAAYAQLSASQQLLQYVWPFWASRVQQYGGIDRIRDLYWLNYYPATYKRGSGDGAVVNPHVGAADSALAQGKTYVTAGDIDHFLALRCVGARWAAIVAHLTPYALAPTLKKRWPLLLGLGLLGVGAVGWWWLLSHPKRATYRRLNPVSAGESSRVQSLLFRRDAWTVAKAKRWAASHGYTSRKVDVTPNHVRLRQSPPERFERLRTVRFGKGIQAVVGWGHGHEP